MNIGRSFAVFVAVWSLAVPAFGNGKEYFRLPGEYPQDPSRQVDWECECVVVTDRDLLVTLKNARGTFTTKWLPQGTTVVVPKDGSYPVWVAACGNEVHEPGIGWEPPGKKTCLPERKVVTILRPEPYELVEQIPREPRRRWSTGKKVGIIAAIAAAVVIGGVLLKNDDDDREPSGPAPPPRN